MANYVQLYRSTDLNAPALSGQVGAVIKVFNACLVDGYGVSGVVITSITRVGTTATATCAAADILRLQTGHILTITGCTGGDAALYNGSFAITVASTTTFTYTMSGTPAGSAAGSPVYSTWLPVTSITRPNGGNIALVALTHANSTLVDGTYFNIQGANESDYNLTSTKIRYQVPWVTSTAYTAGALVVNGTNLYFCRTAGTSGGTGPTGTSTNISDGSCSWDYVDTSANGQKYFTYAVANSPTSPATGTISYAKAGLQWTRPYAAGTNSQTYKSTDFSISTNCFPLQIIDNGATGGGAVEAQAYGAEVMTADQTITSGRFPTVAQSASGVSIRKSFSADSVRRTWSLIGDDRSFYFTPQTGDSSVSKPFFYGHFLSTKAGDGYNTVVAGDQTFNASSSQNGVSTAGQIGASISAVGAYVARSYSQTGSSISCQLQTFVASVFIAGIWTYPHPEDSGLYCFPMFVCEATSNLRGRMGGLYAPAHNNPLSLFDTITNVVGLPGITLTVLPLGYGNSAGQGFFDTFGPWT